MGARQPGLPRVHTPPEPKLAGDCRHHRLVTVGADPDFDLAGEIDPIDEFEKAMDEMLARLLAVGHDVDAAVLLQLEGEQRGVALGLVELGACHAPRRP
jgi:hypothetical protein